MVDQIDETIDVLVQENPIEFPKARIMTYGLFRTIEAKTSMAPMCKLCGKMITVDHQYYSVSRKYGAKRYHWGCAERLNIV